MSQGTVDGFLKDTDPTLAADSDLFVASQKATKAYVDAQVAASTPLSSLPGSTYSTVQDLMNASLSSGVFSGGNIVVSGTANAVDVSGGTGFIRAVDSNVATQSFFDWAAFPALSIPINTTRYVGVQYNGGSPVVFANTTNSFDLDTEFPLGVAVNEAGTIYLTNNPWITGDDMSNVIERFDSLANVTRDNRVGGIILSNLGTRNVSVSTGALLARMSEFTIAAINTATTGTFDAYYRDGVGGWAKQSAQTQWNNTQYDDGTGVLATLTAGHYSSRWFYVMTDGSLAMLYGRNDSATLADALNDPTPTSAPDRLIQGGLLIGRFIILKSAATPDVTQTAFETNFSAASVTDFMDLSGFATPSQGGTGIVNDNASTLAISGAFATTLTLSGVTALTLPTSGLVATTSNNLGAFAATTSAQLAGVISDETGTGALVFAGSPTLTGTPISTTAAVDTNTTQIATTAFVLGQATSTAPVANAETAVVGTSTRYARQDHVHPFASGTQVGYATASYTANANLTTIIPLDDTIPQQTEGDQILTATITPKNVSNALVIEFSGFGACDTNNRTGIAALFQDATANALNASANEFNGINIENGLSLRHTMTAGTTSATTFKIRIGPSAASVIRLNGTSAARLFGGVAAATLVIREIQV